VDEVVCRGAEATAVNEASGTAYLPPLWTRQWAVGRGCRCGRSRGEGRGVASVEVAVGQGGEANAVDEAAGTGDLPLLCTWAMGCGEVLLPCRGRGEGRGVSAVVDAVG
jgi:hypothetical protein